MDRLERLGTIDLFSTKPKIIDALETAILFGPAKGKMFGVMECLAPDGTTVFLQAFSGQYNGIWLVDGWAPPLFAVDDFLSITLDKEKQIKNADKRNRPYVHRIRVLGWRRDKNDAGSHGN